MRNVVTGIIPPLHQISVSINPPIGPMEKVYVMTMRGKAGITITEIDRSLIYVVNNSEKIAPVVVFVENINLARLPAMLVNLFGKGKQTWLKP